ncbi:MAG TPA: DUF1707 domain-containing protein [Marmoricola sp.]|nr:DUF1707 domain-containing protein [Marmoricola sp.]
MSQHTPVPWDRFSRDPRVPSYAALRASDLDRSVALDTLAEAYADGRLDREEYDARAATVQQSRTMGELVPPLRDLVPDRPPVDLQQAAVAAWRSDRREAFFAFLVPSLITWAIWFGAGWDNGVWHPGFAWPMFVSIFTLVHLLRVSVNREEIIAQKREKLERKRRKELGQ